MKARIRVYKESDFAACRSLWAELTQHHRDIYEDPTIGGDDPGHGFDDYLARNDRCGLWVAEYGEKLVGFAGLLDTVGQEGVAEIEPVVVSADSRGQGTGSTLIKRVIEEALNLGFRFLSVRPELRNEKAFAFYVKLGFNKVGAVELFQDLSPASDRKWKSGIQIHGKQLYY